MKFPGGPFARHLADASAWWPGHHDPAWVVRWGPYGASWVVFDQRGRLRHVAGDDPPWEEIMEIMSRRIEAASRGRA